jgi:3-hydroxyisobutyrate dehydrogenase-like beta-hydroxyacid dehydrogenase
MTSVAFIGLGYMGAPMAARLLAAGHRLTVWNRTPSKAAALAEQGARVAGSPAEAAATAEVTITMVADPAALEAVVFGPGGLAGSPLGPVAQRFRDRVARDDGPVQYALDLAAKDLDLAVEAAGSSGRQLRLAAAARTRYQDATADGLGRHDMASVVPHARGLLARTTPVEATR